MIEITSSRPVPAPPITYTISGLSAPHMQVLAEILGRIAGEYTGSRGLANDLHAILYTHGFVFTLNSQGIRGSIKFDDK